jgi:hypothetical protein
MLLLAFNEIFLASEIIANILALKSVMQLSLFHPLGTLSHRVSEGDGRPETINQNILKVPERE